MFESIKATREAFENAHQFGKENAPFLLDLYIEGDLVDTIHIEAKDVELLSGITPESPEYYVEYDKKYWASAKSRYSEESR